MALKGHTVWLGFRGRADSNGTQKEGLYIDDVRVSVDVAVGCTTEIPSGPAVSYRLDGFPATAAAGIVKTFGITALDADSRVARSYAGTATLSTSDTKATLPASFTFVAGVAADIGVTFGSPGPQSVTATDSGASLSLTGNTTVSPGAASALVFSVQPTDAVAGAALTPAVAVALLDAYGNSTGAGTNEVTLTLANANGAALAGTRTLEASAGVATFSDLLIAKSGSGYALTATATGLTPTTSDPFAISVAAAAKLLFSVEPQLSTVGLAIAPAPEVIVADDFGNLIAGATDTVTLTLDTNAAGATLRGTTTGAATGGVAAFASLVVERAGAGFTLTAAADGLASATSAAFEVKKPVLVFALPPVDTVAGSVFGPVTIEIRDAHNDVISSATDAISLTLAGGGGATLGGTTTLTATAGVVSFADLVVERAGEDCALAASATGLVDITSPSFDVRPASASRLAFVVQPSSGAAGTPIAPAVQVAVRDGFGNTVTAATHEVTLALDTNDAGATLAGVTSAAAANGIATFATLTLDRASSGYALVAAAAGLTSATSDSFAITAGPPARLVFIASPVSTTAGTALAPVQVAIEDIVGNRVLDATTAVLVSLGANPNSADLLGTTSIAAASGVATFGDLVIEKAGTAYTLGAAVSGLTAAASAPFDVAPAAAARLAIHLPLSVSAGVEETIAVRAFDAYDNLATGYAGTGIATSSDAAALLPPDTAFVAGEWSDLRVTFTTGGSATLTVTDRDEPALFGSAQTVVTPFAQPTVAIIAPADGAVVTGVVTITAVATVDPLLVVSELVLLVDGAVVATASDPELTAAWDTTALAARSAHSLSAVVTDSGGNIVTASPVVVTIGDMAKEDSAGADKGCGCGATAGSGAWAALLLVTGLLRRLCPKG